MLCLIENMSKMYVQLKINVTEFITRKIIPMLGNLTWLFVSSESVIKNLNNNNESEA